MAILTTIGTPHPGASGNAESSRSLDRDWIMGHIPHQGGMCLLDRVEAWDSNQVRCSAVSHLSEDNPLRANGQLAAVHGIEYAAQAMAVHGALLSGVSGERPRLGYLASVRGVDLRVPRLDQVATELSITAERLSGDTNRVLYGFDVSAGGRMLLSGRAAVVLDAALCPYSAPGPR